MCVNQTRERWRLSLNKLHVSDFICEELIEMCVTIEVLDHCHQHLMHGLIKKKMEVFLKTVKTLVSIKHLGKQSPFCSWFFSKAAYMRGNQGRVNFPELLLEQERDRMNWTGSNRQLQSAVPKILGEISVLTVVSPCHPVEESETGRMVKLVSSVIHILKTWGKK